MSYQDLQINLTGKDVSASDALRGLARAAAAAAKSTEGSLVEMTRKVSAETDSAYAEALAKMAKARRLATIESAKSFDEMGNKIAQSASTGTSQFGSRLTSWAQSGLAGILGGVAASVASSVTSVVADAGQAIIGQLKSSVVDYNSQLENATIGFTTMLGSGGKATDFLNTLQDFAKRTPFQFGDLTQYAQQMLGYGITAKEILPDLTALGDATSASGRTDMLGNVVLAFEQMSARGRIDLQDMNQMTQGGVPALQILANSYGVTKDKMLDMISTGKVMSSDALPRLTKGIEKGTSTTKALGGMMEKQSGTFTGAMSNIHDAIDQTLSKAFKPFYSVLEQGAGKVQKWANSKEVQKWATDTQKALGHAFAIIGDGLKKVFDDPKMQKALGKLGGAIGNAFKDAGPALQRMMPDLIKFGKDVFPAIVDGITSVVKHFPQFVKGVQGAVKELAAWGPAIAAFIGAGANIIGWLIDTVSAFQQWHDQAQKAIVGFLTDAKKRFGDFTGFFKDAIGSFGRIGGQIVDGLVGGIRGGFDAVTGAAKDLAGILPGWVRNILGIASPSKVFHQIGVHVGEGLRNGLLGSVDQVKSASSKLAAAVVSEFKSGAIGKGAENAALGTISRMSAKLQTLSNQRASALANVASLKTDRANEISTVRSSNIDAGNVTSFAAPGDAIQGLQSLVANTRRFKTDLQKLAKMGIDRTTFDQLVAAGVTGGGLTAADQLIANPMDFKQIVSLQKQLGSASGSLANYAGGFDYNKSIALQSGRAKVYGWEMQKVAAAGMNRAASQTHMHIHVSGYYAGTKDELAKSVTTAIRDAVRRGHLPKNILTAL